MIQGAKEIYLFYSKEFQTNQKRKMSEKSTTSIPYVKTFLSMIPLNKQNQNHTSKLALLGPGIESPRTKHLGRYYLIYIADFKKYTYLWVTR